MSIAEAACPWIANGACLRTSSAASRPMAWALCETAMCSSDLSCRLAGFFNFLRDDRLTNWSRKITEECAISWDIRKTLSLASWINMTSTMWPVDNVIEVLTTQTLRQIMVGLPMGTSKHFNVATVIMHQSSQLWFCLCHLP